MSVSSGPSPSVATPYLVYCATCFVLAEVLYVIALYLHPFEYTLAIKTWIASFLFVGTVSTICSLGGLVGLWLLVSSIHTSLKAQVKVAILMAVIACGFFFAFTLGEDRLLLGAVVVSAASLTIAFITKTYTRAFAAA